jgi:hypothetical protein
MTLFFENIDKVIAFLLMIGMSISLRLILQIFGQRWITTVAHTSTLFLLPIITYTITNVISGNIALSLGMVGALSIVRFRNPVRSPLELSVYFGSITMGITASVSLYWLIFFKCSIIIIVLILYFINLFSKYFFNRSFFNASFTEGNNLSTLEISSSKPISELENNKFLTLKRHSKDKIHYILVSNELKDLVNISQTLENNSYIIDYEIRK